MSFKGDYGFLQHLGILLIVLGLLLVATPYIIESLLKLGKGRVHPLIYYPIYKGDNLTIGISPIILIILVILYALFTLGKGLTFRIGGG